MVAIFIPYWTVAPLVLDVLNLRNPLARYYNYKQKRGMSRVTDWLDWLGGYPFEVSKPEEIFEFYQQKGFSLAQLKTCGGGLGNNEYVFVRG